MQIEYPNLHIYNINSISLTENEEYLISSDDLRINLWNSFKPNTPYNLIDLKPKDLENLYEVITSCQFHPFLDYQFIYSTSQGIYCFFYFFLIIQLNFIIIL